MRQLGIATTMCVHDNGKYPGSLFAQGSFRYEWPLRLFSLGGDVDTLQWEVKESAVKCPTEMLMLADSSPGDGSSPTPARGLFDATIDPTTPAEWPSNRHHRRTMVMFCDGHAESALRNDIINPNNEKWHRRWNNDNSLGGSWTAPVNEANKSDL